LGLTQPPIQLVPGFFSENKAVGSKVDHSPPSTAVVMNKWSYTSAPPICLHSPDRDKFLIITIIHLSTQLNNKLCWRIYICNYCIIIHNGVSSIKVTNF
jgi:hypothetical protein